jgi:hypothetical protein
MPLRHTTTLRLNREAIRELTGADLAAAGGGQPTGTSQCPLSAVLGSCGDTCHIVLTQQAFCAVA